jgi:hypothetical protein
MNPILSKFLSGDFLHYPRLQKWYPYLLLLMFLAVIAIANEKVISHKNKIIQAKQNEYKAALNQLKENNNYLPYYQQKIIREKATKRGYKENLKGVYKITGKD